MSITLFIADDHSIVREGLRLLLESNEEFSVIGEAANGRDAVKQVKLMKPDIVLMDIAMPQMNGIEASRQILRANRRTRIIILSMHDSSEHIQRALNAGVSGYLLKETAGSELIEAVKAVYDGNTYLSRTVSDKIWSSKQAQKKRAKTGDPIAALSTREREVLQLVVEGRSSKQIADMLFLSSKTIDSYRHRLMRKLHVRNATSLTKFAVEQGVITISHPK